jgi:predicted O-methyltransferase YrrM
MMRRVFDVKTKNRIVWNGEIVMSRSEAPFFRALFRKLEDMPVRSVLEVGFGLGISAKLIQQTFTPATHDIVEVDRTIFKDLQAFAAEHTSVTAILGDVLQLKAKRCYDFIFYDLFDYSTSDDATQDNVGAWGKRMRALLKPGGVVCVPDFNVDEVSTQRIPGLKLVRKEVIQVPAYLLEDGTTTRKGVFECWQRVPTRQ